MEKFVTQDKGNDDSTMDFTSSDQPVGTPGAKQYKGYRKGVIPQRSRSLSRKRKGKDRDSPLEDRSASQGRRPVICPPPPLDISALQKNPTLSPDLKDILTGALTEALKPFMQSLQNQCDLTNKLLQTLDSRDSEINELKDEINKLKIQNKLINAKMEKRFDDMEQHGRRPSLRFRRVNFNEIPKKTNNKGKEIPDTDRYIRECCESKMAVTLPELGIARSHLTGPPKRDGKYAIIVRFLSYNVRQAVYSQRYLLKESGSDVLITEDLTQRRQAWITELIRLKREKKISHFWTTDGRVYVCRTEASKPRMLNARSDIDELLEPSDDESSDFDDDQC